MRIRTVYDLQTRIAQAASALDCQGVKLAKQGKRNRNSEEQLFEMMFIHQFLPYWNTKQVKQKECYLKENLHV